MPKIPDTQEETEAMLSLVQSLLELQIKFKGSLGTLLRPCLELVYNSLLETTDPGFSPEY